MELIEINSKINSIVDGYQDLIGSEAESLAIDLAIDKPEQLQASLTEMEQKGRFLRIGIVGRVKSGKSSLLNALFFDGTDILPKAATPMTAALTILIHGETAAAEVEYYTETDIAGMREDHARFNAEIEERVAAELEELIKSSKKNGPKHVDQSDKMDNQREKVRRRVMKDLRETPRAAVAQQYEEIRTKQMPAVEREEIKAGDLDTLRTCLADYVGAKGQYTPFTKSITVRLPEQRLRDIEIVDTPGINDPVVSREERTRALLSKCDVVYVVSPSGQFISHEDVELMDRISGREGVSELYLVNSKVDDQLQSPEEIKAHNGILSKVLESINKKLRQRALDTLIDVKKKFPEVGPCYDKIIDSPDTRVMHTSAICFTMAKQLDDRSTWDEGCQHAWSILAKSYPDFFPSQDRETSLHSLEMLSGVAKVNSSLEAVRAAKGDIMRQRRDTLCRSKLASLDEYRTKLISAARKQLQKIQNTRVEDLDEQLDKLTSAKKKGGKCVDLKYQNLVEDLKINLLGVKVSLKRNFRDTKNEVDSMQETKSKTYTVEKDGYLAWIARKTRVGGKETRTREYTAVRTGAVANALDEMKVDLETEIERESNEIFKKWREKLPKELLGDLRKDVEDSDIDQTLFQSAIHKMCAGLEGPKIELEAQKTREKERDDGGSSQLFGVIFNRHQRDGNSTQRATLEGSEAEEFIDATKNEIINLQKRLNRQIDNYVNDLQRKLVTITPSADIFANYEEEIEKLKEQIGQAQLVTSRINALVNELETIDFLSNSPQADTGAS